jgi:hypothetical protein
MQYARLALIIFIMGECILLRSNNEQVQQSFVRNK